MKNITFEYIHINKILNFILKVFFQGISKENQHYKLPTDLLNSVQGKLGNPIAGLHNQIIPHPSNGLVAYSCQALCRAGGTQGWWGFCHLGVYILLEETDHKERNETTIYCRECHERRQGFLKWHGVDLDRTGRPLWGSGHYGDLSGEKEPARRGARRNVSEAEGTASAKVLLYKQLGQWPKRKLQRKARARTAGLTKPGTEPGPYSTEMGRWCSVTSTC